MKNDLINYEAKDWRKLQDNASAMAKNIPNHAWSEPLMRIASAAMELEELSTRCAVSQTIPSCPHCGHEGISRPYGMNPAIYECNKCAGTWHEENGDPAA